MTPRTRYRVARDHAITVSGGGSFAPGETAVGVDPGDPHDADLIVEGRLIPIQPKRSSKGKTGQNEKESN